MGKLVIAAVAASLAGISAVTTAPASGAEPRWVSHVRNHPGGISNGVRAALHPAVLRARAARHAVVESPEAAEARGPNVQVNRLDTEPPMPQNETSVAVSLDNPDVAVTAANDYVGGGVMVMRTVDGGRSWQSTLVVPRFAGTNDVCTGSDPAVAYSRRDHVFFLAQLCFFRTQPFSEIQVYVSRDNGLHWTPGSQAARAVTNFDYTARTVDPTVFNDKEYITVDNWPRSPHYGRLYVTYTKFHLQPDGFSDYCPIQLSYTDFVDLTNPAQTVFAHTSVQPDNPGGDGTGRSANQHSVPVVEPSGALAIGFVEEECNTGLDPHLLFQRSTDGGTTFLPAAIQIDKPGQYRDNPDPGDLLQPTAFRAPNTISIVYNSGVLTYLYQNNLDRGRSGANISFQQSRDGGRTWSDMRWLSTAGRAPAPRDQFFPWIAEHGAGNLFAIWYDRRLDPRNRDIHTWQAISHDNGRTWTQRRISTAAWNPNEGFFRTGAFIGDYNGIAVSRTHIYPVWTDGRNSAYRRTGIGETDIFTDVEPR
jgi:hypothetical protein